MLSIEAQPASDTCLFAVPDQGTMTVKGGTHYTTSAGSRSTFECTVTGAKYIWYWIWSVTATATLQTVTGTSQRWHRCPWHSAHLSLAFCSRKPGSGSGERCHRIQAHSPIWATICHGALRDRSSQSWVKGFVSHWSMQKWLIYPHKQLWNLRQRISEIITEIICSIWLNFPQQRLLSCAVRWCFFKLSWKISVFA